MIRVIGLGCIALLCTPFAVPAQNPPSPPPAPVVTPSQRTAAQDAAAALGKSVTNADIANAIKNSGLSESQVRARLQSSGFDPKMADPFFAASGAGAAANANVADPAFLSAMKSLGIVTSEDVAVSNKRSEEDLTASKRNTERPASSKSETGVFGKSVFSGGSSLFDPVAAGPVDAAYRLGVGDQLQFVITGDMEMAVGLEVRRDGTVVLPQIGQVTLAGLTLDAARTLMSRRAAMVYSVVSAGKAHVDLSVAKVRVNQVFVIGEVEQPGSYQVSAIGTAFRALAAAGGPTQRGSFRNVEVRRGDSVVARIDLYDYLLHGDASRDVRLEQGDVIYVALSRRVVAMQGAIRRPGIYELREGERFSNLLDFAGGLLPTAATNRLQIDRVLPPAERTPGKDRAIIDVPFDANPTSMDTLRVDDNDIITVFMIGDTRRNRVDVRGEVYQPGTYEWSPDLTMGKLVQLSQGFLPWALTDRIKVERPIVHTGRSELFSLNQQDSSFEKFQLQEFDVVTVLDGRRAFPAGTVDIVGSVFSPGERAYVERETLADLIDIANGFEEWARTDEVKLTRVDVATGKRSLLSFNMKDAVARAFPLQPYDHVEVLDARTTMIPGFVTIVGSVVDPGVHPYVEHQTLRDLIDLSGGLKPEAALVELARRKIGSSYSDTSAIVRAFAILPGGRLGDGADSVVLLRGDNVSIRDNPGFRPVQQTVTLSGLFTYPGLYVLKSDAERLSDVVQRAGGLLPSAYAASGRLLRQGRPVAIDIARALRGDRTHNIVLAAGDRLEVGSNPSVVYVTGAVERQIVVPFRRDWDAADYIQAAGGFSNDAQKNNIVIEFPSGEIHRAGKHLFYSSGDFTVVSGATVTVGRKPEEKAGGGETLNRVMQITTTVVALFLAYKTATR